MKDKKSKKQTASLPFFFIGSLFIGACMGGWMARTNPDGADTSWLFLAAELLFLAVSAYLQIILHEAGHLAAGLLSGYRFVSFRIGNSMVQREGERLHYRRLHLPGTGGQCLMDPPMQGEILPFRLYNLGGILMNLLTAAAAIVGAVFVRNPYGHAFLQMFALMGILFALSNGIPMKTALISNDGYNVYALGRDAAALRAFRLQMHIHALQAQGIRPKDMPAAWFAFPDEAGLANAMTAAIGVFAEGRAMDQHDFETAKTYIAALLDAPGTHGLYKNLLTLDRVFIDLIEQGDAADMSALENRKMRAFCRQMRFFPSVIRTQYAAAVLHAHDDAAAQKLLLQFEKSLRSYPSAADAALERELVALAAQRSDS